MPRIRLNGRDFDAAEGTTVLQAADLAGIAIPRFCYHPAFPPEGSCRLCLVEIEGSAKLELACATPVRDGLKVETGSARVREARRAVLELFLADHPIDCPICDKAGECLLQDYYLEYDLAPSAFGEAKARRAKKVPIGRRLLLDRERCVLCTRCVRFLRRVTGTGELGVFERGNRSEISIFEGEIVDNNYSGNLVDVCPVGAITDAGFRFKTRCWFLQAKPTVCPLCSRGCNIVLDVHPGFTRAPETTGVYRARPRRNAAVNGDWMCDVGRHGYPPLHQARPRWAVWNKPESRAVLSPEKAVALAGEKLGGLRRAGRAAEAAIVLTSWLTDEELGIAAAIFRDGLGISRFFFADPRPGPEDDLLLRSDRSPNAAGARRVFDVVPAAPGLLAGARFLAVFSPFLEENADPAAWKEALAGIAAKLLVSPRATALDPLFDYIWPSCLPSEKSGTFVNGDGLAQRFEAAVAPCGERRPDGDWMTDLGGSAGLSGPPAREGRR